MICDNTHYCPHNPKWINCGRRGSSCVCCDVVFFVVPSIRLHKYRYDEEARQRRDAHPFVARERGNPQHAHPPRGVERAAVYSMI